MAESQPTSEAAELWVKGQRRIFITVALITLSELLHTVLGSIASGAVYRVALIRFVLAAGLAALIVTPNLHRRTRSM